MKRKEMDLMFQVVAVFGFAMIVSGNYWRLSPIDWPSHLTACYTFAICTIACVSAAAAIAIMLIHEMAMAVIWKAEKAAIRKLGLHLPWWVGWFGGLAIMLISACAGILFFFGDGEGMNRFFQDMVDHGQLPLVQIMIIIMATIGVVIGHGMVEVHTRIHWAIYKSRSWIF